MIRQDSWVLSGTIRSNLDPFGGAFSDEQLWRALEMVNLKDMVQGFQLKLGHVVEEKGSNLSQGTKQLLCMARVLLKQPGIIFMDEATSSVDTQTDAIVQQAIKSAFDGCTIVTIAHRLNTVIDYDRILVLRDGEVVEFGHPAALLEDARGAFSRLVANVGEEAAAELRSRARASRDAGTRAVKKS